MPCELETEWGSSCQFWLEPWMPADKRLGFVRLKTPGVE
jgi:hypothetical protein